MADTLIPDTAVTETVITANRVAQVTVRTDDPTTIAQLGLPAACSISRSPDGTTAVWLGPDEWLLYRGGVTPRDFVAEIEMLCGSGAYVCDTSAQRTRIVLDGPHARTLLAHGCAIDLDERSFDENAAAQTLLAQAGVILHRTDPEVDGAAGFVIFVRSSFADYLTAWLIDSGVEYRAVESTTSPNTAAQNTDNPHPKAPTP